MCLDAHRKDGICTQMKVDISAGLRDWRGDEESHCLFSFILTVSPSYIGFEGFKRGIPEKGSWGELVAQAEHVRELVQGRRVAAGDRLQG